MSRLPPRPTPPASRRIARRFADFAHGLRLEEVPAEVSLRARHLMLDAIGCAMAARGEVFATRRCRRDRSRRPRPRRPQRRHRLRRPAADARRRAPQRHADARPRLRRHPHGGHRPPHRQRAADAARASLPGAASSGAADRSSPTSPRSRPARGSRASPAAAFISQGFHPTGVVGAFASALAAGRLIGLDAEGLARAQGIALSMAQRQPAVPRGRRLDQAAASGLGGAGGNHRRDVRRARHPGAARRLRRPLRPLSPLPRRASATASILRAATDGLDARRRVAPGSSMNVAVKPFAMCHFSHAAPTRRSPLHRRASTRADPLGARCCMPAGTMPVVCDPIDAKRRPSSDYDAKFSVPYAVASGLLRGRLGLRELVPAAFGDAEALALMDRIHCVARRRRRRSRATTPARCVVTLDDGTTLGHRESGQPRPRRASAERTTRCATSSSPTRPCISPSRTRTPSATRCSRSTALDSVERSTTCWPGARRPASDLLAGRAASAAQSAPATAETRMKANR